MDTADQIVRRLIEDEAAGQPVPDDEPIDAKAEFIANAPSNEKFLEALRAAFPKFDFRPSFQQGNVEFGQSFDFVMLAKDLREFVPRREVLAFARRWYKANGIPKNLASGGYSYPCEFVRRFLIFP